MRKKCPICGSEPQFDIFDLGRGHDGYPGKFSYSLTCPKCGLLKSHSWNDIYCDKQEVFKKMDADWNAQVKKIERFLARKDKHYVHHVKD